MNSKKCKPIAIICFIASALCAVGLVVSGILNSPKKTERFLNRYEKLCNAGDEDRIEKLYFEDKSTPAVVAEIPYKGLDANFLLEDFIETGDKEYLLTFSAYYEVPHEEGGKMTNIPHAYSGNELKLKKTLFGYRIMSVKNAEKE